MGVAALVVLTAVTRRAFSRVLAHPPALFVTAMLAATPLLAQNASPMRVRKTFKFGRTSGGGQPNSLVDSSHDLRLLAESIRLPCNL